MTASISPNQLASIVHRMIHLITWLWVAVFHIALLAIALFALYLLDIKGADIYTYLLSLGTILGFQAGWQFLSFFGVSGFALISAYAIFVKKYAVKFSIDYLWKNISDHKAQPLNYTLDRNASRRRCCTASQPSYVSGDSDSRSTSRTTSMAYSIPAFQRPLS